MIRSIGIGLASLLLAAGTTILAAANDASASTSLCSTVAAASGFSGEGEVTAIAVCLAESGGNPDVWYCDPTGVDGMYPDVTCPGQYDRGMWQLSNGDGVSNACAFNAYCNGREAYNVSDGGRYWGAWTTYTSGTYDRYMGVAEDSVGASRYDPPAVRVVHAVKEEHKVRTDAALALHQAVQMNLPGNRYMVKPGDTLFAIAEHYYDNGYKWPMLFDYNRSRVHNPSLIFPGQILDIPGVVA